jgi:putative aminopeptidase FrvX
MSIPRLLEELLRAHAASGHEEAVQAIVRREAAAVGAEVESDVLGSTIATLRGSLTGSGRRLIALFAHADQVGLVVRGAGDDGLLTVAKTATWLPTDAWRQRVRVLTRAGEVRGVVVGERSETGPRWDGLRIDIGAASREEALTVVRPGDPIVLDGAPEELRNGRILATALDDRAGVFACLEVLRRLAADPPVWDVAVVVSTQEESGPYAGARSAAERLRPEVAIVVEVTYASDAPGESAWGDIRLGGGPAILRAPVISPTVSEGLMAAADALAVPFSIESGQESYSDADGLSGIGGGIACGMVSIPLRYMHTAGEVAQLSDVDAASRLVASYVSSLTAETSFLR